MKTFSATHMKQNLGEVVDAALKNDVAIMKHGKQILIISNADKVPEPTSVEECKRTIIQQYFENKITRTIALKKLGYSSYFELLNEADRLDVRMPTLPDDEIKEMSTKTIKYLSENGVTW